MISAIHSPEPGRSLIRYVLFCVILLAGCGSKPNTDLIPKEVRNLDRAVKSEDVKKQITDKGELSVAPIPKWSERNRVTWKTDHNPLYKKIQFDFTERDRWYMIRVNINENLPPARVKQIKEALFEQFFVSWEFPGKSRREKEDLIFYTPKEGKPYFFIEVKNLDNRETVFEIFDKKTSAEDRIWGMKNGVYDARIEAAKKRRERLKEKSADVNVGWGDKDRTAPQEQPSESKPPDDTSEMQKSSPEKQTSGDENSAETK
jgi:hypothetical protein